MVCGEADDLRTDAGFFASWLKPLRKAEWVVYAKRPFAGPGDPLGSKEGALAGAFELYIGKSDPANPLLSPVNGDLDGFPPTILISGTRDLLLSDTVRMHRALRAAGVVADLHVYDRQTHGDYMQNLVRPVPEADDAQRELRAFFDKHLE